MPAAAPEPPEPEPPAAAPEPTAPPAAAPEPPEPEGEAYADDEFDADDTVGAGEEDFETGMRQNAMERDAADADNDGKLDFGEFCVFVREREEGEFTDEELKKRFDALDEDGSGKIDMAEYLQWSLKDALMRSSQRVVDLFRVWDEDRSGTVDKKEFHRAVRALGFDVSKEDTDAVFDSLDDDKSGALEYKELNEMLRKGAGSERAKANLKRAPKQRDTGRGAALTAKNMNANYSAARVAALPPMVKLDATADSSIEEQLALILKENSVKLIDLFREWDDNGDGALDKKELRASVAALGYDAPKKEVDAFFDSIDVDGSGFIEFHELKKALTKAQRKIASLQPKPAPPTAPPPKVRTPRSSAELPGAPSGSAADAIESARRTLNADGEWERASTPRQQSAQRRQQIGLVAPPVRLVKLLARPKTKRPEAPVDTMVVSQPRLSVKQQKESKPYIDLSQMTRLYASDRDLRAAAFLSLDLPELAAPLPQAIVQHVPGALRPISRELLTTDAGVPKLPDFLALSTADAPGRPSHAGAMTARPAVGSRTSSRGGQPPPALLEVLSGRLPVRWNELCAEREAQIEGLINLALRLQAYGRGHGVSRAKVRQAVVEALQGLRMSSLAIVEAVATWLAANEAKEAQRQAAADLYEERRKQIIAQKNAMKGKAPPPPTQAERPQTVAWGVPRAPAAPALNGATATVGRAPSPPRARVPRRNNLVLFSSYSLRFACNPPSEAGRTREAAGLWDGLNYLLKMCTDVWRLPLPTMTDPFFLRWFQDSEYAAERTSAMSEVQRMMEAETILKRLLPHANVNSMAAVETTISLQMTRPYATHLSLKSPGRQMEAYAEATNWRVLSAVLYPPDGPRAFAVMKRKQWQEEENMMKLQSFIRQAQFAGRVAKRIAAKQDKAARVVQHYYKNRLSLGTGGTAFAALIEAKRRENREEIARQRALRRAETELRLGREMAESQLRAERQKRGKMLARALRERAAVETLQCAVRRCLGVFMKRRLRAKRMQMMNRFKSDGTGHCMRMLILFQRRVRLWLANNALYLSYYEEHRRMIYHGICNSHFEMLADDITTRQRILDEEIGQAKSAVDSLHLAPCEERDERMKLCEAEGELLALQANEIEMPRKRLSGREEEARRGVVAQSSSVLDGMRPRLEEKIREHCALLAMEHKSNGAALLVDEMREVHPILMAWTLGQSAILHEHARSSKALLAKQGDEVGVLMAEAREAAKELYAAQLIGPQSTVKDETDRRRKIAQLETKIAHIRRDCDAAKSTSSRWLDAMALLGGLRGKEHQLATLQQLCDWRRWQAARGQRVLALTVLRGTRVMAKREAKLALDRAELKAKDAILVEIGRYASPPPCVLSVRPIIKRLLMNCDVKRLNAALSKFCVLDLAKALHASPDSLGVKHTPDPKCNELGKPEDVGLTLLTQAGACDIDILFQHEDGVEEEYMPIELLKRTEHGLPNSEITLPRVYQALGVASHGGPVSHHDMEWKIRNKQAPEPELVQVRRRLTDRFNGLQAEARAKAAELETARQEKKSTMATLAPGEQPPRTRAAKLAAREAEGLVGGMQLLMDSLPEQSGVEDPHHLQFVWLPNCVRAARAEVAEKLKIIEAELAELQPAVKSRLEGKQQMLYVDKEMATLRDKLLPTVEPPLEEPGSLIVKPMHADFYHNPELMAGRRALAVSLAKYAARMLVAAEKQISMLETEDNPNGRLALDPCITLQRCKALMLMTQDQTPAESAITPDKVLQMAAYLGIILDNANSTYDGEPEYCFLWIAVEALRAPMPPLWQRTHDGTFQHVVTQETSFVHPMMPVFVEHVRHERARKKETRPFQNLERFMLFATEEDGESGFAFFNFATRQMLGGRKLPAEAVAEQAAKRPPAPPPKKRAHRATAASQGRSSDSRSKEKASAEKGAQPPKLPKAKPLSKEQVANLRALACTVRKSALSIRPRSLPEMMVAAKMFHIDLVAQPSLVWVIDLCLACDYLPTGWAPVPREEMSQMAHKSSKQDVELHGYMSTNATEAAKSLRQAREVTWLPPMERLWHVAMTGAAPPQYSHHMCSIITERHPLGGFVRTALGLDAA